jgi:hypothetical protein
LVDAKMDVLNMAIYGNPSLHEWRKSDSRLWEFFDKLKKINDSLAAENAG